MIYCRMQIATGQTGHSTIHLIHGIGIDGTHGQDGIDGAGTTVGTLTLGTTTGMVMVGITGMGIIH